MFNANSGLVQIWVRLILTTNGQYTLKDVPDISNLREEVAKLI